MSKPFMKMTAPELADAFARRHGLSRSDLFARGLRIVFAAAGLLSPGK